MFPRVTMKDTESARAALRMLGGLFPITGAAYAIWLRGADIAHTNQSQVVIKLECQMHEGEGPNQALSSYMALCKFIVWNSIPSTDMLPFKHSSLPTHLCGCHP